jgi:SAM-dependent methyltransferase
MSTIPSALPLPQTTDDAAGGLAAGYRPFPDEARRNLFQEWLEIPLMVRALGLPTGGRILEVGCGRGIALPTLARMLRPSRLVGIDNDAALLTRARLRLGESGTTAELHWADVRALPFVDASFDLVVDFGTCYHISGSTRGLAEIARVLTPGGLFVEETPLSQVLSHPVRSFGRRMPWGSEPGLVRGTSRLLWSTHVRH